MDSALAQLLQHGPLGLTTVIFIVLFLRKDKELADERAARIEDSKAALALALDLQSKTITAIDRVGSISELAMASVNKERTPR